MLGFDGDQHCGLGGVEIAAQRAGPHSEETGVVDDQQRRPQRVDGDRTKERSQCHAIAGVGDHRTVHGVAHLRQPFCPLPAIGVDRDDDQLPVCRPDRNRKLDDDGAQQRPDERRPAVHGNGASWLDQKWNANIAEQASILQRGLAVGIGLPVPGHRPALLTAAQHAAQQVDRITTLREETTRPHHTAIPVERVDHSQRGEQVRVQCEVMPTSRRLLPIEIVAETGSISNPFRSASPVLTPRCSGTDTPGAK